ncbi:MAG: Asp-tRNA(Asn)/Glu-tRNA(Gln) amidotransferase subunit GatA [Synergistetes bacterium]|nr:Asp-tRNA(Asn)/Glu-tRNA(Gln) amidotransferase subunit GatA [Synergistota bacterium]MCX8127683.1 Asp-tRNA(Asn)/Glu-tRNA(Gln) amidotransferase subunit GatA [Synergistota bacterium]MDW8191402.1 Asp-tRNA(Asn)/Glu-tRNA(Gln) amidotransferase subunit GatA [Synergistota bacterium]
MIDKKEIIPEDILDSIFRRIDEVERDLHSYITILKEEAYDQAKIIRGRLEKGEDLPLGGIPIAIKDIICTKGVETTCASKILKGFYPPYDATVVNRVKKAGAIIIGKTNLDEFAMGSSTENSAFGPTRNPWCLERVPGGSSGGSAAAVAAGETILSLGSDTGGSVRQPASFCGIVGLKPTYGLVSRYGLIAYASSLDQIGPMTKDVKDCALLLQVIAGKDDMDSTSLNVSLPNYLDACEAGDLRGIKLGIPKEYISEALDPSVAKVVEEAKRAFERLGAKICEISLPHTEYALPTYYIIAPAEASSNLARYDGVQYGLRIKGESLREMYLETRTNGFGDEVKRRIMIGTYVLSAGYYDAFYLKALKVRRLVKMDFDEAFKVVDYILTPTSPTPAFRIGEKVEDPLLMYLSDIFTVPVNLAGIPAISINGGFSQEGLPIGIQIMGRALDEFGLLKVASAFERETELHAYRPYGR